MSKVKREPTLEERAYEITHTLVRALARTPRMPPPVVLSPDDLDDLTGDVYVYILPKLAQFDPQRGKLVTFLYKPVTHKAVDLAWRLARGGITGTTSHLRFVPLPTDAELSEAVEEGDPAPELHLLPHELGQFLSYESPPEGLEIPGSEDHWRREERDANIAKARELLKILPESRQEEILARWEDTGAEGVANQSGKHSQRTTTAYVADSIVRRMSVDPKRWRRAKRA